MFKSSSHFDKNQKLRLLLREFTQCGVFVALLGWLLVFYVFLRGFFLFWNWSIFGEVTGETLSKAMLHGLRFDVSVLLMINAPFLLLDLWPRKRSWPAPVQKVALVLFGVLNAFFIGANIVDTELFSFTGRRLVGDLLALVGDWSHQATQLIGFYWVLALLVIGLWVALFWVVRSAYHRKTEEPPRRALSLVRIFVGVALVIVGIRGGFQLKPLRSAHAYETGDSRVAPLVLNSSFTLIESLRKPGVQPQKFFESKAQTVKALVPERTPVIRWKGEGAGQNIVLIIMESFALEYMGWPNGHKGYTPFLDSLAKKSLFFSNAFANGRRSIEAIPSLLAGLPSLMPTAFVTSNYQANEVHGMGEILKDQGYTTSFFHGGQNGTMFFDSFSHRLGFDRYYGLNEYGGSQDDQDGTWGVYDEPFFQYSLEEISKQKSPFMSVIFSLSSHQPYRIPAQLKGHFPKGTLEIHESLGYADYALGRFFEEARKKPWFKDTLFIITADHTQKSADQKYQDRVGAYRVPLMFYRPGTDWSRIKADRIVQHSDLMPSVLDWLGIPQGQRLLFGRSIFSRAPGRAFNFSGDKYWLLKQNTLVQLNRDGSWSQCGSYSDFQYKESSQGCEGYQSSLQELKAVVQYYTLGLTENSWYHWWSGLAFHESQLQPKKSN